MDTAVTIEGAEHIPERPALILPNRMTLSAMATLEKALGGAGKVAWLVDTTQPPEEKIIAHLRNTHADGIQFSSVHSERSIVQAQISTKLAHAKYVVLLPGKPQQPPAYLTDVPPHQLDFLLTSASCSILPLYLSMLDRSDGEWTLTTEEKKAKVTLRILALIPPSAADSDDIRSVWAEAEVEWVHRLNNDTPGTLAKAILNSLIKHSSSRVIDGVDEQVMTYRRLLTLAAPVARHLRRHIRSRRVGIILPPGRLSIIANTACILAGISPVNFDFSYTSTTFTSAIKQADVTHHICSRPFMQKMEGFSWPPSRDIIFIDDLITSRGHFFRFLGDWIASKLGTRRIAAWIDTPHQEAPNEALCVFTSAQEGSQPMGACHSHEAVLTGWRMTRSRLLTECTDAVLSTLPFSHRAGLLLGLIYPLLSGQNIITYPESKAGKRIMELARQFKPAIAVLDSSQIDSLLSSAPQEKWPESCYTMVTGKVSPRLASRAREEVGLSLYACYLPLQAAMPIACSMPGASSFPGQKNAGTSIPTKAPDGCGLVLPGVTLRLSSLHSFSEAPPGDTPGLVWVKGPGISPRLETYGTGQAPSVPRGRKESDWVCTYDLGHMDRGMQLSIDGRRERFSFIGGELISHEQVETLLRQILHVDPHDTVPRIAVVSLPGKTEREDDTLILLSTLHKVVGPHDAITIRYAIANARISANNAPQRIIALRAIPTLAGGGHIDYAFCRYIARQFLLTRH